MAQMNWISHDELLNQSKDFTYNRLSEACRQDIIHNNQVKIHGDEYRIHYSEEFQINMQDMLFLMQNSGIKEMIVPVYSLKDEAYTSVTLEQEHFKKLFSDLVESRFAKLNHLRTTIQKQIDQAQSQEELDSIEWDF